MSYTKQEVRVYIESIKDDYIDDCNEFDYTGISEDAADEFDIYEDNITREIPQWVFDLVVDICDE